MAMQAPTRITIEVHPPQSGESWDQSVVRVVPEAGHAGQAGHASVIQPAVAPREEMPAPAAYDPGPCRCLDDEDCAADHANE
jgi:hypothetical protein